MAVMVSLVALPTTAENADWAAVELEETGMGSAAAGEAKEEAVAGWARP
jgi:hypothetical protein